MTDRRSSRLFISNLGSNCNQSELKTLFEKIGPVTSLSINNDIAYLEFENPENATTAIEKYDNYKFEGSRILVEFALKTRNFHRGKPGKSDRERDMAAGRCFKCNEKGHIARYCPNNSGSNSRSKSKDKKKHRRRSSSKSSSRSSSYSSSKSASRSSSPSGFQLTFGSAKRKTSQNKSKRKSTESSKKSSSRGKEHKKEKPKKKEHSKRKHS